MQRLLSPFIRDQFHPGAAGWALTVLRVTFPLILLLGHGLPKLQGWSQMSMQFPDLIGIGSPGTLALVIFAEVFCAGLIVLGIATRLFAIPVVISFTVAVLVAHATDPFARKELALLFLLAHLVLLIGGGGKLALGRLLFRGRGAGSY
jgi:putative oxidoreductase